MSANRSIPAVALACLVVAGAPGAGAQEQNDPDTTVFCIGVRDGLASEFAPTAAFLKSPDPHAYERHPLATTKAVTIEMEYDEDTASFVTYVKELHRMSTFGPSEFAALENTAEMIRGYIKSMEANRKRIPISAAKLAELKQVTGVA